jgi:hypothetical protein
LALPLSKVTSLLKRTRPVSGSNERSSECSDASVCRQSGGADLLDEAVDHRLHLGDFSLVSAGLHLRETSHRFAELLAEHVFVGARGVPLVLHLKELLLLRAVRGHEIVVLVLRNATSEGDEGDTGESDFCEGCKAHGFPYFDSST